MVGSQNINGGQNSVFTEYYWWKEEGVSLYWLTEENLYQEYNWQKRMEPQNTRAKIVIHVLQISGIKHATDQTIESGAS